MTNRSMAKGTSFENQVVQALRENGVAAAERRAKAGKNDRGDIAGLPLVMVEVKAERTAHVPQYLREVDVQVVNDGAEVGFCWAKMVGKSQAMDGYIVMRPAMLLKLLGEAGYL